MHPLDTHDRRELAQGAAGIGMCNITKCCTEVCPEGIHITDNAIIPMKERVVDKKFDPLVWLGDKIGIRNKDNDGREDLGRLTRAGTRPKNSARPVSGRRSAGLTHDTPGPPGAGQGTQSWDAAGNGDGPSCCSGPADRAWRGERVPSSSGRWGPPPSGCSARGLPGRPRGRADPARRLRWSGRGRDDHGRPIHPAPGHGCRVPRAGCPLEPRRQASRGLDGAGGQRVLPRRARPRRRPERLGLPGGALPATRLRHDRTDRAVRRGGRGRQPDGVAAAGRAPRRDPRAAGAARLDRHHRAPRVHPGAAEAEPAGARRPAGRLPQARERLEPARARRGAPRRRAPPGAARRPGRAPADRRALLLLLLEDPPLPYREISARLGIPIGSIGPTRVRALAQLRNSAAMRSFITTTEAQGR